ncbi:hypothetical protein DLREEDagrD3_18220 [Denitratisoma sp. agr-D3]
MTKVQGTVLRVEDGQAIVEVIRSSGCGRCHEPGGCGGTTLATGGAACPRSYSLANDIDARPGDKVWVAVREGSVLRAAAWAYGLPGALMVASAALAASLTGSDLAAFGGALAGLAIGYGLLRVSGVDRAGGGEHALSIHPYH